MRAFVFGENSSRPISQTHVDKSHERAQKVFDSGLLSKFTPV